MISEWWLSDDWLLMRVTERELEGMWKTSSTFWKKELKHFHSCAFYKHFIIKCLITEAASKSGDHNCNQSVQPHKVCAWVSCWTQRKEVKYCVASRCKEAVGGRGGSAVEIILSFWPKSCACWADQGLREEWCYPVAVTQTRAFHLTCLAALQPAGLETQTLTSIRSCWTVTAKSG